MPNEIPDEFATWRSRLRQPDALPEQGLDDKEAAWDKLFLRLSEKPRLRVFGYRLAAACLLLTLIPVSYLFHGRGDTGAVRRMVSPPVAPVVPVAPVAPAAPPAIRPAEALRPVNPLPVTRRTRPRPAPVAPPALAKTAPAPASSPAVALTLPPPVTTPALPVVSRPAPKKQLKVTDLSELGPGHQMPHGMTANTRDEEDTRLKIHLTTQQNR